MNTNVVIDRLCQERPSFHGDSGGLFNWALGRDVLIWLADSISPGDATVETGCGYSSVVFAAAQALHTTVSPLAEEHQRIQEWGEKNGIDFATVTFRADRSERVLPYLAHTPLKVALIDGWHAFPGPYLDWFFLATRLQVHGFVLVDDTQLRVCRILRDFLLAEKGRWRHHRTLGKTEVFQKLTDEIFVGDWETQPYGARPILGPSEYLRRYVRNPVARVAKRVPGMKQLVGTFRKRRSR